jgi:hypothetical protein
MMAKMWDVTDPVHMKPDGYQILANAMAALLALSSVGVVTVETESLATPAARRQSWIASDDAIAVRAWAARDGQWPPTFASLTDSLVPAPFWPLR